MLAFNVPFSRFVDIRDVCEMLRLVLGLDFLSPLTFRSGTTIPGDVVIGGFYGLMMLGFSKSVSFNKTQIVVFAQKK